MLGYSCIESEDDFFVVTWVNSSFSQKKPMQIDETEKGNSSTPALGT